jgi:hypothetical protein
MIGGSQVISPQKNFQSVPNENNFRNQVDFEHDNSSISKVQHSYDEDVRSNRLASLLR